MCDEISTPFKTQTSNQDITFAPKPFRIPFVGPTYSVNAFFTTLPKTKAFVTQGISLEILDPVCDQVTFLQSKATIKIGRLKCGPYADTGGDIDFKSIFFNFYDLTIQTGIKYNFDSLLICDDTKPKTYNIDNMPFETNVISVNFDPSKYFTTNTDDDTNINPLFKDLIPLFLDGSGNFIEFWNSICYGLLNSSGFGRQVEQEMDNIYCKDNNQLVKNPYRLYDQKIKRLKQKDLIQVFLTKY